MPGYEILAELGRGGMGVVYKAVQPDLRRIVALKMILSGAHAAAADLERFRTEAQACARLQHTNIVQIYHVGEHDGLPFFALEFCSGGSLDAKLNGTPLPPNEAAALIEKLAKAMQAAHEHGVIHRDLKPANILLAEDGTPKITDFGLAKMLDQAGKTQSGSIMGTPSYMAPEQADGKKNIGPAADVYALGAILFECLTGRPPFKASTPMDTILQVLSDEPVPPSRLNAAVPRDVETICLRCLRKEPDKRYASAAELAEELGRFLRGEPIRARPVGMLERGVRWARRNRMVASLLVTVVLVLLGGILGTTIGLVRAERARSHAEEVAKSEKAARREAEEARQRTREALNTLTDEVVERLLSKQVQLGAREEAFLRTVQRLYEGFAQGQGNSEAARREQAGGLMRLASIRQRLGELREAEPAGRQALALFEQLAADFPDVAGYRRFTAICYNNLGNLLVGMGRRKEAEAAWRQALDLQTKLTDAFPTLPDYRHDWATHAGNLANAVASQGRTKEAEVLYRQARDLERKLADDYPKVPAYRQRLVLTCINLGNLLDDAHRTREAEAAYQEALSVAQKLVADFPAQPDHRWDLARAHRNRGMMLARQGRGEEAESAYREALTHFRKLVVELPSVPEYRRGLALGSNTLGLLLSPSRSEEAETAFRDAINQLQKLVADYPVVANYPNDLAGVFVNLAHLKLDSGNPAEARRLLEQALPHHRAALRSNPRNLQYRHYYRNNRSVMCAVLVKLADHKAAAADADELAHLASDPGTAYDASCIVACCAPLAEKDPKLSQAQRTELAHRYAERAMALLRQAVKAGWKDAEHIKKDPDLDSLRTRQDFKDLLAELEKTTARNH